jgi:microcystin-dependent protein
MSKASIKVALAALLPDNTRLRISAHRAANSAMVDMFYEPEGIPKPYIGATAPDGWHLLDGGEISRTDYPMLFALWGTTYGVGNGTTTFNLPNWPQGTSPVQCGVDFTLGYKGGSKSQTLKGTNIPQFEVAIPGQIGGDNNDNSNKHRFAGGDKSDPDSTDFEFEITIPIGNADPAPINIMNPYFAVNWIIQLK